MSTLSRVPKSRTGIRTFYRARAESWAQRAQALGIDPARAAELAALAIETEQAYEQQLLAIRAAHGATLRYNQLLREMGAKGASLIHLIHGHAELHGSHVYQLAQLAPPDPKSPIGPPGVPYKFTASFAQGGALTIRWECKHPRGAEQTNYSIFRRIGHAGPFEFCGTVGKKQFTDDIIPPGTASVTYRINAFRTTGPGPSADFPVNFGGGRMPQVQLGARKAM